jgi:quinone-modifying oxidoreductase subunit QmoC
MEAHRQIKLEADLDRGFADWIVRTEGGERLRSCIQCGTCSATCPMAIYMDYTPRRLINLARAGFKQEVLASQTPWLCASCYACMVECPQKIAVTDVLYAIKRRALEEGRFPRRMPLAVLAREFFRTIHRRGRITESLLVFGLLVRTSWRRLLGMSGLGLRLMRTGRFNYRPEGIKNRRQLRAVLDHLADSRPGTGP